MKFTSRKQAHEFYSDILNDAEKNNEVKPVMAQLVLNDLFFLLVRILNRLDVDKDWLFERCVEVQNNPNGYLDLWAREHYKSTIITFGLTIQDVLYDPEITIGLFSITRPNAKDFLNQIRTELEDNKLLYELFPHVLWENPRKQAPVWSLDDGIVVKRKSNPKELTIEAHGLVEGMPTGKHFKIRLYDDVLDEKNVTNPDMIKKATKAWELSLNLGSAQRTKRYDEVDIERYVGTRYHMNDPYAEIMKRKAATPRILPGTIDGTPEGKPVFWTKEFMAEKRRKMGPYVFGCQILQDPRADEVQGFKVEWVMFWPGKKYDGFNIYLLCDPAGEKKKENDYTCMWVIGLGADRNYYIIDGVRDRLNLPERTSHLIKFHRMYSPIATGYEKYGKDSDIEHIEEVMHQENYHFEITPLGGPIPKFDRIRKLIPIFADHRVYFPDVLYFIDRERRMHNLTREFIDEELINFPVAPHDDMLDNLARIRDPELGATFPMTMTEEQVLEQMQQDQAYDPSSHRLRMMDR